VTVEGVVLGVVVCSGVVGGVPARVFSIIKEAAKVRLTNAVKSMLFFNSTHCVFMFLLNPP
jgi:hypothetical protein